ncbi:MAG: hypothetical protein IJD17_04830 [Clostridia bacterium]|nr:hypothetical protein [Clostridia bacterium]
MNHPIKDNSSLIVEIDPATGGLSSMSIKDDVYKMNWCESTSAVWGVPFYNAPIAFNRDDPMRFVSFDDGVSLYENAFVRVVVKRYFNDNGVFSEEYSITNITSTKLFFGEGDFGIFTPFNDNYESAAYCLTNKCHTHINCGADSSWVCALRMGDEGKNVGLIVTEGSISCYRQCLPPYAKNDRGDFILCLSPFSLEAGESAKLCWEIVVHKGKNDFMRLLSDYKNQISVTFENETVFVGEKLRLRADYHHPISDARILLNGKEQEFKIIGDSISFEKVTDEVGHIDIDVMINGYTAHAAAYVSPDLEALLKRRVDYIVSRQQHNRPGSALDGAYLIYDTASNSQYFSNAVADHNASRERIGMGILIAKYLQRHNDEKAKESLFKYISFVLREFVDPETGDVFDTIGRDPTMIRLYNAPWVCVFMTELWHLTGDNEYLMIMSRVMKKYYEGGGDHFYPNAISIDEPIEALRSAGLNKEADELFDFAVRHTAVIIANGTDYPKHEVDYEQTISAPAVTFLLALYKLTSDKAYIEYSEPHLELLERFNGFAPDYHLNEVAIRHWDDYWFGKSKMFGDTFPHYWSVLSGWAYKLFADATGSKDYAARAEKSARNCLCLFMPDGSASCAYVYPYKINDKKGKFFDEWANDQDFALYYAIKMIESDDKTDD